MAKVVLERLPMPWKDNRSDDARTCKQSGDIGATRTRNQRDERNEPEQVLRREDLPEGQCRRKRGPANVSNITSLAEERKKRSQTPTRTAIPRTTEMRATVSADANGSS